MTATFAEVVAFNLTVAADDEDLAAFGAEAGPLAALLAGSSVAGVLEEDRLAAGLALGGVDLLQVRVVAPGEQYLRFNLGALAELATGEQAVVGSELDDALADRDLEPAARDALLAAARGEWVRLMGEATDGTDGTTGPGAGSSVAEALAALLRSAEPVGHEGDLEAERFDGRIDVEVDLERALAAAAEVLAGVAPSAVPTAAEDGTEVLPGRVLVEDGVVRSVILELGALADGDGDRGGEDDGSEGESEVELVLDLRTVTPGDDLVTAPPDAVEVTREQLERGASVLPGVGASPRP